MVTGTLGVSDASTLPGGVTPLRAVPPKAEKVYFRESVEIDGGTDGLPMVTAIGSMSDEIAALLIARHGGHSRELSMLLTKLDEARLWAIAYSEKVGTHVVIDKRVWLGNE